jgi:hypothetical protein
MVIFEFIQDKIKFTTVILKIISHFYYLLKVQGIYTEILTRHTLQFGSFRRIEFENC